MDEKPPSHRSLTPGLARAPLFPPRIVPSFYEVVGADVAADYTKVRESLGAQELQMRLQSRAARRLGHTGLGQEG